MSKEGINSSESTIERVLKEAGFAKLSRRSWQQRGLSVKEKMIPKRSEHLDFEALKPFEIDCPVAGIFFFLPYIIESGIVEIIKSLPLPHSSDIDATGACLSILLLKLIGNERLSHIESYDHEVGLAVFAGLNMLPKSTYMNTYSCLSSEMMVLSFREEVITQFRAVYPQFHKSGYINLDFHSIPHYGDKSEMEKIRCGARHKSMKAANSIFAQDSQSNMIPYTRSDILRKEESKEIKKFIT